MKALEIARVNMVRTARDRMSLFFILVLPMILIVVLGMTYGGMNTARIGVADEDGGPLATDLSTAVATTTGLRLDVRRFETADQLRDAVERGFVELGLVIHQGYDAALRGGGTGSLEYVSQPQSYATAIRTAVDARIADQAGLIRAARFAASTNGVPFDQAGDGPPAAAGGRGGSVPVESVGEVVANPSGFAVGAESQVILFMFLTSMTGAVALIVTRQLGISRREFSTPTSAGTIVLGETLGRFAFALFQGVFIVAASALLFGVDWIDPLATGAIVVSFALVSSGAAMLLATLVSNEHQLSALGPALGMVLALLGGAMVPIEVFPPVMRTLSLATPHAWAIDAFHDLLLNGGGVARILPQLAVLMAFAVGLLTLAAFRFRRQVTGGGT